MSMRFTTCLGPYVEVRYRIQMETVTTDRCPSKEEGCKYPAATSKYCPTCGIVLQQDGKPIERFTTSEEEEETPDLFDLLGDSLVQLQESEIQGKVEISTLIPNFKDGTIRFSLPEQDEKVHDLTQIDIPGEIKKVEEFYSEELAILRKHYDEVHVRWGLVEYFS